MLITKEIEINEKGQIVIEDDLLSALDIKEKKFKCIVDGKKIIIIPNTSLVDFLYGYLGKEKITDYEFDIELERFKPQK